MLMNIGIFSPFVFCKRQFEFPVFSIRFTFFWKYFNLYISDFVTSKNISIKMEITAN